MYFQFHNNYLNFTVYVHAYSIEQAKKLISKTYKTDYSSIKFERVVTEEIARREAKNIDSVLIAVKMPEWDGIKGVEFIRELTTFLDNRAVHLKENKSPTQLINDFKKVIRNQS